MYPLWDLLLNIFGSKDGGVWSRWKRKSSAKAHLQICTLVHIIYFTATYLHSRWKTSLPRDHSSVTTGRKSRNFQVSSAETHSNFCCWDNKDPWRGHAVFCQLTWASASAGGYIKYRLTRDIKADVEEAVNMRKSIIKIPTSCKKQNVSAALPSACCSILPETAVAEEELLSANNLYLTNTCEGVNQCCQVQLMDFIPKLPKYKIRSIHHYINLVSGETEAKMIKI